MRCFSKDVKRAAQMQKLTQIALIIFAITGTLKAHSGSSLLTYGRVEIERPNFDGGSDQEQAAIQLYDSFGHRDAQVYHEDLVRIGDTKKPVVHFELTGRKVYEISNVSSVRLKD